MTSWTTPQRGYSSSSCSSVRAGAACAGPKRRGFFLRCLDNLPLYFRGFAGGEVADLLSIRDLKVYLDVDTGVGNAVKHKMYLVPECGTVDLVVVYVMIQ